MNMIREFNLFLSSIEDVKREEENRTSSSYQQFLRFAFVARFDASSLHIHSHKYDIFVKGLEVHTSLSRRFPSFCMSFLPNNFFVIDIYTDGLGIEVFSFCRVFREFRFRHGWGVSKSGSAAKC